MFGCYGIVYRNFLLFYIAYICNVGVNHICFSGALHLNDIIADDKQHEVRDNDEAASWSPPPSYTTAMKRGVVADSKEAFCYAPSATTSDNKSTAAVAARRVPMNNSSRGRTVQDRRAVDDAKHATSVANATASTDLVGLLPLPPSLRVATEKGEDATVSSAQLQFEERAAARREKLAVLKKEAMERVLQKRAIEEQHSK